MKKLIALKFIIFLFFPCIILGQELCADKTIGKYKPAYGPYMNTYEITRTDSTQTDFDKVLNTITEYKIIWINDCEYQLQKISGKGIESLNKYDLSQLLFKINRIDDSGFTYLLLIKDSDHLIDTTELKLID